jgi:hypothetical protein
MDTRAMPRKDEIITQWKIVWLNLSEDQTTFLDNGKRFRLSLAGSYSLLITISCKVTLQDK